MENRNTKRRMKSKETQLQKSCVRWFRLQYRRYNKLLFAVPNGGKRDPITASRLKAEGVVPGVSDLIFLYPNGIYPFLCIEMKYGKNEQSEHQKEWQEDVESVGGLYLVINSFDSFKTAINNYIRNGMKF